MQSIKESGIGCLCLLYNLICSIVSLPMGYRTWYKFIKFFFRTTNERGEDMEKGTVTDGNL